MCVTQIWCVILPIFVSMASIHNARFFIFMTHVPHFLAKSTLSHWVVSCLLVYAGGKNIAQCHQCHPRPLAWLVWHLQVCWTLHATNGGNQADMDQKTKCADVRRPESIVVMVVTRRWTPSSCVLAKIPSRFSPPQAMAALYNVSK